MKKVFLVFGLLSTGLLHAEDGIVFSHSHNGKSHSHALSVDNLEHDHDSVQERSKEEKKGGAVHHDHNGRSHSHPLPAEGKSHVHNLGVKNQETEPQKSGGNTWLKQGGWVSFKEVCEYKKTYLKNENMNNANCNTPTVVTQKSNFALWAGEITHIHYNPSTRKFSQPKIRVTWSADKNKYQCGKVLQKNNHEIKEFTHRSVAMKKCSNTSKSSGATMYSPADVGAAVLRYFYF